MPKSFTPKSGPYLKEEGWLLVGSVECVTGRYSRDLLGFIDLWAYHPERGHLWVQVTSRGKLANRKRKILEEHLEDAKLLMTVRYNRFELHGWDKHKNRWRVKVIDITDEILAYRPEPVS